MNFSKISPKTWLLLILTIGFILRSINLTIGFPILYLSNDEAIYHLSALNMLANKTPFTIGNYGPLGAYIQIPFLLLAYGVLFLTGKVHSVSEMEFLIVTHEGYFLFIPRIISAMFGTLTILVAYKISKELFKDTRIALYSALLTALSFNLVFISHQARAWSPAIFFSMLSIYHVIKYSKSFRNNSRNLLFSVLFASISFGFHQIGGLIYLLIFMTLIFDRSKYYTQWRKICLTFLTGLILLLIFNYLSLGGGFINIFNPRNESIELVRLPFDKNLQFNLFNFLKRNQFLIFTERLLLTDLIIVLLVLLFLVFKRKQISIYLPFIIFIFINYLLSVFIFPPFMRYFLIAFSIMPVFAGYSFYQLIAITKHKCFLGLTLLIFASCNTFYWSYISLKEPTFTQLRNWIINNIDSKTPLAYIGGRYQPFTPSETAIKHVQASNKTSYKSSLKVLTNNKSKDVRNVVYVSNFSGNSKYEQLINGTKNYPVVYIIDNYLYPEDSLYLNYQGKFKKVIYFSPLRSVKYVNLPEPLYDTGYNFSLSETRIETSMYSLERTGPYFDVLRLND